MANSEVHHILKTYHERQIADLENNEKWKYLSDMRYYLNTKIRNSEWDEPLRILWDCELNIVESLINHE